MIDLRELGADVPWTDADAATSARDDADPDAGRLGELAEWLAGTSGAVPPPPPRRARLIVFGGAAEHVRELAAAHDVGLVEPADPDAVAVALDAGAALADKEIEAGADLVAVAGRDPTIAPAVALSVLTGVEPVALLPRGAQAVDSAAWIADAAQVRDTRRATSGLRDTPDELAAALGSVRLAAAVGVVLRSAARRTPVLLDGALALAAAVVCAELQPRCGRWWQVADVPPGPVATRALEQLLCRPVLDLGAGAGDGTAAVLAVAVLRAAAARTTTAQGEATDE